jgi:hypothetical protein
VLARASGPSDGVVATGMIVQNPLSREVAVGRTISHPVAVRLCGLRGGFAVLRHEGEKGMGENCVGWCTRVLDLSWSLAVAPRGGLPSDSAVETVMTVQNPLSREAAVGRTASHPVVRRCVLGQDPSRGGSSQKGTTRR